MENENLLSLAQRISKAGREIAKDRINKDYTVARVGSGAITVTSDSGYEAIYIGNLQGRSADGYMCLYTNNTEKRNSFPNTESIAELLEKVVNKKKLPTGEGKAAYYDWEEFGGMKKQLTYFSDIVSRAI